MLLTISTHSRGSPGQLLTRRLWSSGLTGGAESSKRCCFAKEREFAAAGDFPAEKAFTSERESAPSTTPTLSFLSILSALLLSPWPSLSPLFLSSRLLLLVSLLLSL